MHAPRWLSLLSIIFIYACQSQSPIALTFITTTDFHGNLSARTSSKTGKSLVGGHEYILGYFDVIRNTNPHGTILLDAGDIWQGTLLSNSNYGHAVTAFYNIAGYDAVTIGNHEFDFGPGDDPMQGDPLFMLKSRIAQAQFPFLSANMYQRRNKKEVNIPNLKPFTIITRKGVRIGVLGLSTTETPFTTQPAYVRDLDFAEPIHIANYYIPIMKQAGAQIIVVLAHMGMKWNKKTHQWQGELLDLAKALHSQVDLFIGGHSHIMFSQFVNGTPVIQAWSEGRSFGRVDLFVDRFTGRVKPELTKIYEPHIFYQNNPSGSPASYQGYHIKPNNNFMPLYNKAQQMVAQQSTEVLGVAKSNLDQSRSFDTLVGNLVTDAVCQHVTAELCLINRFSIRAPISRGTITYGSLFTSIPFDSNAVTISLTGQEIIDSIEHGANSDYGPLEISGMSVTMNYDQHGKLRVKQILINGVPLLPNKLYRVGTNDFLLNGGDGFKVMSQGKNPQNTHITVRKIVKSFIQKQGTIAPDTKKRYIVLQ